VLVTPYAASFGGFIPAFERQILAIFSIITLLTLAVVGANVANLMLARAVVRQRETAVRHSLGASRGRLMRLIVAEGFAIASLACVFAFVLAWWAASLVPRFLPANRGTMPLEFTPDWRVAVYAFVLTLTGTIMSSLVPSIRTWKHDLLPSLKDGSHTAAPGRSRLSSSLVVVQLAFSVLLLTVGVLAYRSWASMSGSELGFDARGMLLVNLGMEGAVDTPSDRVALLERIRQRLDAIPNVSSVSYTREWFNSRSRTEIRALHSTAPLRAQVSTVGNDYLKTLGVTPIAGRDLSSTDQLRSGGAAVVNQRLAATLFPGGNAVGETLMLGDGRGARDGQPDARQSVEIVGVVPDLFYRGFNPERADQQPNYVFLSDHVGRTTGDVASAPSTFYVRYSGALAPVSDAVPGALREVDSRVAIASRETLEGRLEQQAISARLISTLLSIFAGISLFVAAIGQYAAVAFETRRRTRDFGVRLALGASGHHIVGSVLRSGTALTAAGLAGGFVLSLAVATVLQSQFFGVTPTDPPTYLVVFVLLACVSLFACYLPARRASRIDPVQALRQE
jgi:predicted permease